MLRDSLAGGARVEVRTDLEHRQVGIAVLEEAGVPFEPFEVVVAPELRFLDPAGKSGVPLQHRVQPGGSGPRRTDCDCVRQPKLHCVLPVLALTRTIAQNSAAAQRPIAPTASDWYTFARSRTSLREGRFG